MVSLNSIIGLNALVVVLRALPTFATPTPPRPSSEAPTKTYLAPRAAITSFCGQNNLAHAADFILYNNLWGEDDATSGSQCTYLDYDSGNTISWHTSWTWEGGSSDVKSYANAVLDIGATKLSSISSLQSTWNWR